MLQESVYEHGVSFKTILPIFRSSSDLYARLKYSTSLHLDLHVSRRVQKISAGKSATIQPELGCRKLKIER